MATNSMMKDYVRRQLRYWVDNYKDDMLPRDFMTKSYTKTQLMLPEIYLKPHRIASVMHLPPPLLATSVRCVELTIAVPSWTNKDKEAAHKPVLVHANELLVQVRNVWECSSKVRRGAEERVQAALLEPDPLGSTAAMLEFARDVNDRTKLVVDKLRVQIFVGGVSRVEFILADVNARTTDALWEDVKDPTLCVDYSPDHLVQTRFKAMSFMLSVGVTPADANATAKTGAPPIYLMKKASVVIRVTRFYHRQEIAGSWRRHMQLVDVNCGAMKLELGVAEFMEVYTVASTLCNWFLNGRSSESSALSAPMDGMAADREPLGSNTADQPNIELQITFRITIEAKLKFASPTEGPQELVLTADGAAGNIIFHKHDVRELQMSLHELAVRFRGYVVFRLKPDREVFHVEQRLGTLSVRWRVQSILCRIDDDLVAVLTEMYHFVNEKEEAIVIRCGTCHQQISIDMIDVHVCPPRIGSKSLPSTPHSSQTVPLGSRRNSFAESSSVENSTFETDGGGQKSSSVNVVHAVLHMDELELQAGSGLVKLLLKLCGVREHQDVAGRTVTTKLSNLRLTTESNEFSGDAVFVPALPLAFQMLECSLQGCGCILGHKGAVIHEGSNPSNFLNFRWPARLFLDATHCAISVQECAVTVDNIKIRSSFSDGSRICSSSQPQLSFHVNMDKIRCRLDDALFKLVRQVFEHAGGSVSSSRNALMVLFFGVLQIRVVEFTLQNDSVGEARAKSLLKQAIAVFDNQLGFLCTQSSLDFKTVLNSQMMQFVHRQTPAIRTNFEPPIRLEVSATGETKPKDDEHEDTEREPSCVYGKNGTTEQYLIEEEDTLSNGADILRDSQEIEAQAEITIEPPEFEREDACRCIQRMVRRQHLVRQQKQRFEADDYEPGVVNPIQASTNPVAKGEQQPETVTRPPPISSTNESNNTPTPSPRKSNMGIPSPITILSPDSDFVGEIRGGINKLMSPLSRTPDSIRGGINKLMGPINRTLSPMGRRPSTESAAPVVEVTCYNVAAPGAISNGVGIPGKSRELRESTSSSDKLPTDKSRTHLSSTDEAESSKSGVLPSREDTHRSKLNGFSAAKLAALPEVVRVLVQVAECRLCVPINPREKVEFLCREIVRRFNESFSADRGSIALVSLQDKHGGVFSPTDTVAVVLFLAPSELLFAYPHEQNGQIRSLAWIATASSAARARAFQDPRQGTVGKGEDRELLSCSRLPLPLVIALLANESERDLIRLGLCKRASTETGEDWPDLALNAASLDPERNPLVVEVAWHETSIEVTNGDAFALCRQLLGLCTSRATSKYVGKVLRGRLKVDSSNPLVQWAWRRRMATGKEENNDRSTEPSTQEQMKDISYEHLKKVVQDTYGIYTR